MREGERRMAIKRVHEYMGGMYVSSPSADLQPAEGKGE